MDDESAAPQTRRDLLAMIGTVAGGAVMYQAMTSLGHAEESPYTGPIRLEGDPRGASVLILGAGLAGMVAALELRKAGYQVQVLEYQDRLGGRNWTLRGGDTFTELGGETQTCRFDPGLYINPGPWRVPYHHHGFLDYAKRLGVRLEPFVQVNHNAYAHSANAYGGKPKRFREVQADFIGNVAEMLAKAANQDKLDQPLSKDDKDALLAALRSWGALDGNYTYRESLATSDRRGFERDPGGGLAGPPQTSKPLERNELMRSGLWRTLITGMVHEFQTTIFQPVGGMDMLGKALAREVGGLVRMNAKVTKIHQDPSGVTVTYTDTKAGGAPQTTKADWCLCTIPLSILSQIEINVGSKMAAGIDAASAYDASVKVGLQFRRRFWEQDDAIFGGISTTDLPIRQISYPSSDFFSDGKGVLLGAYPYNGPAAYLLSAMSAEQRVRKAVEDGSKIHPQYPQEFENGVSVAWHRIPWTLGCAASWPGETRKQHYADLCAIDGRIALAGEHLSYLPAWQEGAILSSLDAITRLHKRIVGGN